LDLILNEASTKPVAKNINVARERMQEFLILCRHAIGKGVSKNLRTKQDFRYLELSPDYLLLNWLNDNQVDREIRRLFKIMVTKSPYIDNILEEEIHTRLMLTDFEFEGKSVEGLGAAFLLEGIATSFNNNDCWDNHVISLEIGYLDEYENYIKDKISVRHMSKLSHLKEHDDWLKIATSVYPLNGKELWNQRSELYPSLLFCDNVFISLRNLTSSHPVFKQICTRLQKVNDYFINWSFASSSFESFPYKVSPESESTLTTYKKEHTFKDPEGVDRLFSFHFRITPLEWRIFFEVDYSKQRVIIGHIGDKLPNVTYPT